MSIPPLVNGLLPAGVHVATTSEVQATFGLRNQRRVELFQKLETFLAYIGPIGVFEVIYVDGSFVTDKDHPGDIDAVLQMPRTALGKLLAHANGPFLTRQSEVKHTYEIHLFVQPGPAPPMANFFQGLKPADALARNLAPDTRRGILKVTL